MSAATMIGIQTVFAGIIALTTIAYTVATVLLWRVTRKSVESLRSSTYGLTLQGIAQNHREIAFRALSSTTLQKAFMSESPVDEELNAETRLFAGVLINHLETIFEHCRFRTVPHEFEKPILDDISLTFRSVPALRRRWSEMKGHVEPEFSKFVDGALAQQKQEAVLKQQPPTNAPTPPVTEGG